MLNRQTSFHWLVLGGNRLSLRVSRAQRATRFYQSSIPCRTTSQIVRVFLLTFVLGCGQESSPVQTVRGPAESKDDTGNVLSSAVAIEEISTESALDESVPSPHHEGHDGDGNRLSDSTIQSELAEVSPRPNSEITLAEKAQPSDSRRRLPDDRPDINAARLTAAGIRRYESKHLILLTDVAHEDVSQIPEMADQLFDTLSTHFGKLPEALDGSDFQVTGHLIADESRFRAVGLMAQEGFTFNHGRHLNYQFWVYDTDFAYYRRHLIFHEFIHCFMTCESGMLNIPPLWYIEGMAEYFATHQQKDHAWKKVTFGILPEQFEGYEGWGRISELRRSYRQGSAESSSTADRLTIPSLLDVMPDTVVDFQQDAQYATSWALCWMLNTHSQYKQVFSGLRSLRTRAEFVAASGQLRKTVFPQLSIDWLLTYECLLENFDTERSFPVHAQSSFGAADLPSAGARGFTLQANLGWQDTGLRLKAGESVKLVCSGRFSVNDKPKPWISEPQGVSIEYLRGLPLGRVVAVLVDADGSWVTERISIGRESIIAADENVSLWLQVNDSSDSRSNNAGTVEVSVSLP